MHAAFNNETAFELLNGCWIGYFPVDDTSAILTQDVYPRMEIFLRFENNTFVEWKGWSLPSNTSAPSLYHSYTLMPLVADDKLIKFGYYVQYHFTAYLSWNFNSWTAFEMNGTFYEHSTPHRTYIRRTVPSAFRECQEPAPWRADHCAKHSGSCTACVADSLCRWCNEACQLRYPPHDPVCFTRTEQCPVVRTLPPVNTSPPQSQPSDSTSIASDNSDTSTSRLASPFVSITRGTVTPLHDNSNNTLLTPNDNTSIDTQTGLSSSGGDTSMLVYIVIAAVGGIVCSAVVVGAVCVVLHKNSNDDDAQQQQQQQQHGNTSNQMPVCFIS